MLDCLATAFEDVPQEIALDKLLPTRAIPAKYAKSLKFKQIVASIKDIGLIEPIVVTRRDPDSGLHMILDGHLCYLATQALGHDRVTCLVALDDEALPTTSGSAGWRSLSSTI